MPSLEENITRALRKDLDDLMACGLITSKEYDLTLLRRQRDWQSLILHLHGPAAWSTRLRFLTTGMYPLEMLSPPRPLLFGLNVKHTHLKRAYLPQKGTLASKQTVTTVCCSWMVPRTPVTEAALEAWNSLEHLLNNGRHATAQDYLDNVFTPFWNLVSENNLVPLKEVPDKAPILDADIYTSEDLMGWPQKLDGFE